MKPVQFQQKLPATSVLAPTLNLGFIYNIYYVGKLHTGV